jgi:hypothetical protein
MSPECYFFFATFFAAGFFFAAFFAFAMMMNPLCDRTQ